LQKQVPYASAAVPLLYYKSHTRYNPGNNQAAMRVIFLFLLFGTCMAVQGTKFNNATFNDH